MNSMDGARREITRLRARIGDRAFTSGGPPLDEDGLPNWSGGEALTTEGYERACGDIPAEQLTDEELAARERLAPYAAVFARLERAEEEEAVT